MSRPGDAMPCRNGVAHVSRAKTSWSRTPSAIEPEDDEASPQAGEPDDDGHRGQADLGRRGARHRRARHDPTFGSGPPWVCVPSGLRGSASARGLRRGVLGRRGSAQPDGRMNHAYRLRAVDPAEQAAEQVRSGSARSGRAGRCLRGSPRLPRSDDDHPQPARCSSSASSRSAIMPRMVKPRACGPRDSCRRPRGCHRRCRPGAAAP